MALSILIAALSLVGLVAQTVSRARTWSAPGQLSLRSAREPREIRRAAREFFRDGGWQTEPSAAGDQTFSYRVRPAGAEVVLLLLLGIVPGLAYIAFGRRTVVITVAVRTDPQGSATVVSWSPGGECEQACREFASMIRRQEPRLPDLGKSVRRKRRIRRRSVADGPETDVL